ncbi:ubiquitin-like modifier-activating enzyme ATG7 [Halichondria panicea]|uniref:ubiquitin-like modifier-activating enzyme ATG7 n=1 Tax=Halichondria panicea TaxID=6063 RepID=UPI00312B6B4F
MAEKVGVSAGESILQFLPFVSRLETGFWHELGQRKLEKYKLSEEQQQIFGSYFNSAQPGLPSHLSLEYCAFEEKGSYPSNAFPSPGCLLNTNTIDSFKTLDKKSLIDNTAAKIWEAIKSGAVLDNPSVLTSFFLLTFSDLKKFNFYYWFAFPALQPAEPFTCDSVCGVGDVWSKKQLTNLEVSYDKFRSDHPGVGFFLVKVEGDDITVFSLREFDKAVNGDKLILGFSDPSTLESNPGWPLRNYLIMAAAQWGDKVGMVDVLCYRDYTREGRRVNSHSLYVKGIKLTKMSSTDLPKVMGWERNDKNKLAPKMVNLSSSMDPVRLSESSVDLNLKLMRWRLLPSLDLAKISGTRCLLLGSGTLGCNVARCLLGWGVRKITMVDNGTVSYSNPVRQSLFTFEDCVGGGRKKALAAAESLRLIFPGVNAEGVELSIPMPGHHTGTEQKAIDKVRKDVEQLQALIQDHDVVFLLMDTRESRWLPTLLACHYSKICVNAALGFDTYMVMRHGFRPPPGTVTPDPGPSGQLSAKIPGNDLGCYFCSDVVAPTDSTRDRTLDQMCTVSRPGLSMIAAALVVELLMGVVQHPDQGLAHSENLTDEDDTDCESVLGLVPHQIRGFLSRFHHVLPASRRFDMCTACSDKVIETYQAEGFAFLLKAFNCPNYLEDLTGLSQLYAQTYDDQVWELSEDEEV